MATKGLLLTSAILPLFMLAVGDGCGDDDETAAKPSSTDASVADTAAPRNDASTTPDASQADSSAPQDGGADTSVDASVDTGLDSGDAGCVAPVRVGCGSTTGVTITRYSDRTAFLAALAAVCPRTIGFDDVDAASDAAIAIASDRYAALGMIVSGSDAGGQFVDNQFSYPVDYAPASAPNIFAPGPQAAADAAVGAGGRNSDVTFRSGASTACVAGFGATFIDVDLSNQAKSSLAVYGQSNTQLDSFDNFQTANGGNVFVGMIAVDGSGNPVPVIARAHLVNGQGYVEVASHEGVVLDDFVFDTPAAP